PRAGILLSTLALLSGGSLGYAQTGTLIPVRKSSSPHAAMTSLDHTGSWTFRLKDRSVIHSPIVRLGDVVVPLDPNLSKWPRLSRSAVGLVPVNGKAMRIDRDRLSEVILNADATPRRIDWVGPDTAEIVYQAAPQGVSPASATQSANGQSTAPGLSVAPEQSAANGFPHTHEVPHAVQQAHLRQSAHRVDPAASRGSPPAANLDPAFVNRLIQWIEVAIERTDPTFFERYHWRLDRRQLALQRLESARGIERAEFLHGVQEGECSLRVVSRGLDGTIEVDLVVTLEANPIAVVATKSFRTGHRLGPADLTSRPIPRDRWEDSYCTDPSELLGMETRSNLRDNEPISRDWVGMPMLVRRNDLVEVRVLNGAISVSTNAKALGDGAESELIEIETLQPRKRLIARVVSSGLVEIVTRAPRTH
ncbi:MAG: flagellar basal body P-ring formation chaperone FlgA, partial [Novipirellula sp. JB048]